MPTHTTFGPYLGEFGHAVLTWADHVGQQVEGSPSRSCAVCAPQGTEALYRRAIDAGADWLPFVRPPDMPPSNWLSLDTGAVEWGERIARELGIDPACCVAPGPGREPFDSLWRSARPVRVETDEEPAARWVGVMARDRDFAKERNAPCWWWDAVVNHFVGIGLTPVSLGTIRGNRHIPGTYDVRKDGNTQAVADEIGRCSVVVGESSGGMHLAAAVGRPCVVFGHPHIEERYRRQEALSRVPLVWVDGLKPDPLRVAGEVSMLAGAPA